MRKVIAAFKILADGKYTGPEGYPDWVNGWPDDYGSWMTTQIDACVLGGRMYPMYEQYCTRVGAAPAEIHPQSGRVPTAADVEWSRFAATTPHYVVSSTLKSVTWPNTRILANLDAVAALKREKGKDIYMIGGAAIVGATVDAGLVDELRLIVYPLIRGGGQGVVLVVGTARDGAAQIRAVDGRPVEPGVRNRAVTQFDRRVVAESLTNGIWGFARLSQQAGTAT